MSLNHLRFDASPHYVIRDGPLRTWVTLSAQSFTRAALGLCVCVCVDKAKVTEGIPRLLAAVHIS